MHRRGDPQILGKIPTFNSEMVIEVALNSFCPLLVHFLTARGISGVENASLGSLGSELHVDISRINPDVQRLCFLKRVSW